MDVPVVSASLIGMVSLPFATNIIGLTVVTCLIHREGTATTLLFVAAPTRFWSWLPGGRRA